MKTDLPVDVWIGQEDSAEYWAEGVKATLEVEVTDADEIRVGVKLTDEASDTVTVYVSRQSADRLSRFLAAASVADVDIKAISGA